MLAHSSPYSSRNEIIPKARGITQVCVSEVARAGQLQGMALQQKTFVAHLAMGVLSEYVIRRQVTVAMIERWVMEAISQQAQNLLQ